MGCGASNAYTPADPPPTAPSGTSAAEKRANTDPKTTEENAGPKATEENADPKATEEASLVSRLEPPVTSQTPPLTPSSSSAVALNSPPTQNMKSNKGNNRMLSARN